MISLRDNPCNPCFVILLFYDGHLVDEVPAAAQLIEDEEHVADVECNTTLQVVVEVDVTAQRFPVAVESTADESSLTVDDGRAGVTASDIVRRQEAYGHGAVGHGIASEVLLLDEFLQLGRNHELGVLGIFFLEDTVGSGKILVVYAVFRIVGLHIAISQADGEVSVAIGRHGLFHLAQSSDVSLMQ